MLSQNNLYSSLLGGDGEDEEARRRREAEGGGGGQPPPQGSIGYGDDQPNVPTDQVSPAQQTPQQNPGATFAELQRVGRPRPPMPQGGGARPIAPQQAGGAATQPPPPAGGGGISPVHGGVQTTTGSAGILPVPGGVQSTYPYNYPQAPQNASFGTMLQGRYEGYQGQGPFNTSSPQTATPQFRPGAGAVGTSGIQERQVGGFTPGASAVSAPGASPTVPGSYNPGGFQGSYNPIQSPGANLTGQFSAPDTGGLQGQLSGAISGQLSNPNRYNQDAIRSEFERMSGQIDDQFSQKNTLLEEDMARRGLSDSSIRGGRLADLNVEKRSSRTELADRLLEKMAATGSADMNNAISQGLGYGNQQFSQGLQGYQANQGTNQQNFQQMLQDAAFRGDQNAMALVQNMGIQGFNNQAGQQGFQNQMAGAEMQNQFQGDQLGRQLAAGQFNQGLAQDQFQNSLNQTRTNQDLSGASQNQLLQALGFNQGLAQDQFQNNMAGAQFGAGQNQQQYQNALTNYQANLGSGQQNFNQQQALLSSLLGYQQQGFENQMQTSQQQLDEEFRQRQLAAAMASMGLG